MKCKSDFCIIIATGFLLAYANYFSIMNLFMPGMIKDLYLAFLVVLGLSPLFFRDRKLSKKQIAVLIPWALLICEILFNRNQDLAHGYMQFFVRALAGVSIIFMSQFGFRWQKHALTGMACIGMPNVIATYVFLVMPGLYKIMIALYGQIPVGTSAAGYRAGLQNHYSQNGTMIAFVLLIFGGCLLYYVTEARKMHYPTLIMTVLSFVAIILTSKRAHFLFTVIAFCVVYFVANPRQTLGRGFKLFAAVLVGALALYAVELYQDWQSAGAKYLNSHNTYLQLLCETGVVGFLIYIWAALGTLITTSKALRHRRSMEAWRRKALYVSVVSQVFVLLYNFTGNTLYDYTIFMYSFTAMTGLAVLRGPCAGEALSREEARSIHTGEEYPNVMIAESEV